MYENQALDQDVAFDRQIEELSKKVVKWIGLFRHISPYLKWNQRAILKNQFITQSCTITYQFCFCLRLVIFARLNIVFLIKFLLYLFRWPLIYQFSHC